MQIEDRRLIEAWSRQRDGEAFAQIVRQYGSLVYATCRRIVGNSTDAEDVA